MRDKYLKKKVKKPEGCRERARKWVMRFGESSALWVQNFVKPGERRTAEIDLRVAMQAAYTAGWAGHARWQKADVEYSMQQVYLQMDAARLGGGR